MSVTAYLGLGANLGEPRRAIEAAQDALDAAGITVRRRARLYTSAPLGPPGQPRYWNTACEVETALEPLLVLDRLKAIEAELGRTPTVRWGPRIIDVDLLLYGGARLDTPRLTVPHRELANRRFVLAPLADLAPDRGVPGLGRSVGQLLAALGPADDDELTVVEDDVLTRPRKPERVDG